MSLTLTPQRSKKACSSCRQRKRKCDGEHPCSYCLRNEHNCEYESSRKKAKLQNSERSDSHNDASTFNDTTEVNLQLRLLEAGSPAVFVRQLGLKINPTQAPRLNCYAWNLGLRIETACLQSSCLTEILTVTQMRMMATEFFLHVAPVYNFLDREYVESAIMKRWQIQSISDSLDSMLGGIAALACLFGGRSTALELQIVQTTRSALEYSSSLPCPDLDHVIGWLLRVIYLRATSSPHATWMASCTLMHMIETIKLHLEPSENSILAQSPSLCAPDLRRRIYWVAQLFNIWVSSDYGKSRVELHGASSELPGQTWTKEQQNLCYLSYSLAQKDNLEPRKVEENIAELGALQVTQPMLRLLQCNIGLCFFRRARALGQNLSDQSLRSILGMAENSLQVVKDLSESLCPWWHIINIPFQIVCVLLVINDDSAFCLLAEALDTLKIIVSQYKTEMVRESYYIACFLVSQERQRRLKKLELMANALNGHQALFPTRTTFDALKDTAHSLDEPGTPEATYLDNLDLNIPLLADYFLLDSLFYEPAT
ncbi:Zn(II)2Cys6 transcription factor [Aspergillus saccharolyticus JOP 1030-1]|uniref:Zn(2)-C6 fungal-type domain-containing protein n=1 Tax=Aspergillus saccharolyticus JOP 1030-1 TaxID=1450539 RepID=A0A318ZWS2_9EURO|nr:hypothetical protein BP01DRAFT_288892 [Aspergillus saccharolyticus JOP 1030-1]PYH48550.1 hypothetical protein BP01DRAFT_288892 [Aspergillus saccharolyticus JOP 1030-1]